MSKNDPAGEENVFFLGLGPVEAPLAIQLEESVIHHYAYVLGLSASQIYRLVNPATKPTEVGSGFSAHSPGSRWSRT